MRALVLAALLVAAGPALATATGDFDLYLDVHVPSLDTDAGRVRTSLLPWTLYLSLWNVGNEHGCAKTWLSVEYLDLPLPVEEVFRGTACADGDAWWWDEVAWQPKGVGRVVVHAYVDDAADEIRHEYRHDYVLAQRN